MDVDNKQYTYTDKSGKKHQVPIERVSKFYQLQKGDQIALKRWNGTYWHHAIVEDIDTEKGKINVIEYSNTAKGFSMDNSIPPKNPGKAKVKRGNYKAENGEMYLIKYRESFDADDTIARARSRLGERKYNIVTLNCEHFAVECKTGSSSSEQVERVKEIVNYLVRDLIDEVGIQDTATDMEWCDRQDKAPRSSPELQHVPPLPSSPINNFSPTSLPPFNDSSFAPSSLSPRVLSSHASRDPLSSLLPSNDSSFSSSSLSPRVLPNRASCDPLSNLLPSNDSSFSPSSLSSRFLPSRASLSSRDSLSSLSPLCELQHVPPLPSSPINNFSPTSLPPFNDSSFSSSSLSSRFLPSRASRDPLSSLLPSYDSNFPPFPSFFSSLKDEGEN